MPSSATPSPPAAGAAAPATRDSGPAPSTTALLVLAMLADARLPTGAHAHSAGLEPAIHAGLLTPTPSPTPGARESNPVTPATPTPGARESNPVGP